MKILFGLKPDWREVLQAGLSRAGLALHMAALEDEAVEAFDAVVPLTLGDRHYLQGLAGQGRKVPALLVDGAVEALCHDKLALNRRLIALGFGPHVPVLFDAWPQAPGDYPVILKLRRDFWGMNSRVVSAPPCPSEPLDEAQGFLQAYVPGAEEYATHMLLASGRIRFEGSLRYLMTAVPGEVYVKGQHRSPLAMTWLEQTPPAWLDLFARMLEAIGFREGTCCIDYRVGDDGRISVFEINPRFGWSLSQRVVPYLESYLAALAERR